MSVRILALTALVAVSACGGHDSQATVAQVLDGDTIVLQDGRHVRLVQLDAPEADEKECYAQGAKKALTRLLPPGARVEIRSDPKLDQKDVYGRTLAYVERDGTNINLELVREGAAAPWFFQGDRGRYSVDLLDAAADAKRRHRGLWGTCAATALDPLNSVDARRL